MSGTECRVCGSKNPIGHDCRDEFVKLREELSESKKDHEFWRSKAQTYSTILEAQRLATSAVFEVTHESLVRYRNHEFCDCGCENCEGCAQDCMVKAEFDSLVGDLHKLAQGGEVTLE